MPAIATLSSPTYRLTPIYDSFAMPRISNTFNEEVYAVVELIPHGKVLSYKSVAILAGYPQYVRQVGRALKIVSRDRHLPCHRVVNSCGRLVPHWEEQGRLLTREGVVFKSNGLVDMKQCAWRVLDDME